MDNFYNLIYRLRLIKRWGTSFNILQEDVMQHSYSVTVIVNILCLIINQETSEKINIEDALFYALYHDIPEIYTMHIVSPVKKELDKKICSCQYIYDEYETRCIEALPDKYRELFQKNYVLIVR